MSRSYQYFMCILLLMAAITMAAQAQENNAAVNDTITNETLTNTTLNTSLNLTLNLTASDISSENQTAINNTVQNATALNLSTVNDRIFDAVLISELAKKAPEVAATASSIQVSSQPEGAFLLGPGIGGLDPFHPTHIEIESLKIGMPIKPLRDVGKMVFVCDIV
jgi:hypothetical protein